MALSLRPFVRKFLFHFTISYRKNTGLEPTFQGVFRKWLTVSLCLNYFNGDMFAGISTKDQTVNGQTFKKDDHVFIDVGSANLDVSWIVDHEYNMELIHYL